MPFVIPPPLPPAWETALADYVRRMQRERVEEEALKAQETSGGMGGGVGAAGGALAGAAIGGPVGAVIGGAVGGIAGTLADPPKQGGKVVAGARNQQIGQYALQGAQGYMQAKYGPSSEHGQEQRLAQIAAGANVRQTGFTPRMLANRFAETGEQRHQVQQNYETQQDFSRFVRENQQLIRDADFEYKWMPEDLAIIAQTDTAMGLIQRSDDWSPEQKQRAFEEVKRARRGIQKRLVPGGKKDPTFEEWQASQRFGIDEFGQKWRWSAKNREFVEVKEDPSGAPPDLTSYRPQAIGELKTIHGSEAEITEEMIAKKALDLARASGKHTKHFARQATAGAAMAPMGRRWLEQRPPMGMPDRGAAPAGTPQRPPPQGPPQGQQPPPDVPAPIVMLSNMIQKNPDVASWPEEVKEQVRETIAKPLLEQIKDVPPEQIPKPLVELLKKLVKGGIIKRADLK